MAEEQFAKTTKPGDLIEIFRGTFNHWAIYIGGNEVVHLCVPGQDSSSFVSMLAALTTDKAEVRRAYLSEVVGYDRFQVNNLLDDDYEPHDPDIIVKDALAMVGMELPYSVTSHNCEHFVTNLRYGKPESRQVKDATVAAGVAIAGIGIVALGALLFSSLKQNNKKKHRGWDD